jgi:hypothetical protein
VVEDGEGGPCGEDTGGGPPFGAESTGSEEVEGRPGGQDVEKVRSDVEGLDIPRVAILDPLRDEREDDHGDEEHRIEQVAPARRKAGVAWYDWRLGASTMKSWETVANKVKMPNATISLPPADHGPTIYVAKTATQAMP